MTMRQVLKKFDRNGVLIIAGAVAGEPQDPNVYYRGTIAQLRLLRKTLDEILGSLLEENASQATELAHSVQVLIPKEAA